MAEQPKVRSAPEWLKKQREAQRKYQAEHPPTMEKVREQFKAAAEHSFRHSPYYKTSKNKKDGKPRFYPVWSTHQTVSEGGRKIHLFEASHVDRCRSGIRALCRRMISLATTGSPIPDVEAWAGHSPQLVCRLCYYRATNRMPVRGINEPKPWPRPE